MRSRCGLGFAIALGLARSCGAFVKSRRHNRSDGAAEPNTAGSTTFNAAS
jgi:hypothetical protein